MVLTTRGRRSGQPRHTALEYRQHGSKFYLVSAWGRQAQWVRNLKAEPNVTIQCGRRTYAARARVVDDVGEANRAIQLFRRQLPYIYDTLLAKVVGQPTMRPYEAATLGDRVTVVRLDRLPETPTLPPLRADLAWVLPVVTMVFTVTLGWIVATRTRRS